MASLSNRHVVITGSAGGLGGAVVEAFAAAGAICHLPGRRAEGPPPEAWGPAQLVGGVDLTNETDVSTFYAGRPPIWASIHLAGGYAGAPVAGTSLAQLRQQLEINLVTAFLCCREAVRHMQRHRSEEGGRIVNVTSRAALIPGPGVTAYAASKAAVNALTLGLAEEVKADGILVAAVAPSTIDTPANRAAMPGADPARWPKPAEIAAAILWLASPDNRLASGAILPVYGRA